MTGSSSFTDINWMGETTLVERLQDKASNSLYRFALFSRWNIFTSSDLMRDSILISKACNFLTWVDTGLTSCQNDSSDDDFDGGLSSFFGLIIFLGWAPVDLLVVCLVLTMLLKFCCKKLVDKS